MKQAKLDRGYDIQELPGGGLRFTGKGAGLGVGGLILIGFVSLFVSVPLAGWLTMSLFGSSTTMAYILIIAISAGIVALLQRFKQPPFAFEVTQDSLIHNGTAYSLSEITELFVDNPSLKGQEIASSSSLIVGGTGLHGLTVSGTAAVSNAVASGLANASVSLGARVNYRVNLRHGRRVVRLAKSLREDVAIALFHDLNGDREVE